MTFSEYIIQTIEQPIIAIVIGEFGWEDSGKGVPLNKLGVVLPVCEALSYLNYEYHRGYGAPGCHAVNIYTKDRVYFIVQYDGSTNLYSVPRNPSNEFPDMPGN